MQQVVFETLEKGLIQAKSTIQAAEAHGLLCGLLSSGASVIHKKWLDMMLDDWDEHHLLNQEIIQNLSILHLSTLQALNDSELKFYLFLPLESEPISKRLAALTNWCQGFLYGFGLHINDATLAKHQQIGEAIQDIQAVTQVKIDEADEKRDEADENDFIEVSEYLRMAILMIYDTLQPIKNSEIKLS